MSDIPYGYCHCGCGGKTSIAKHNHKTHGYIKGEPLRFIRGHSTKKRVIDRPEGSLKQCSQCEMLLDVSLFYSDTRTYDGLRPSCKDCLGSVNKAWRDKNPEYLRAYSAAYRLHNKDAICRMNRAWRAKNLESARRKSREWIRDNPDKANRARREWASRNPDKLRLKNREYRARNIEAMREKSRAYWRNNPEARRANRRNRRARLRAAGGHVSAAEWQSILDRFNGKCAKCGASENIHMDHVVPLAKGGRHSIDNVQPLCQTCNLRKHTKTEDYRGKMYRPLELSLDDQGKS